MNGSVRRKSAPGRFVSRDASIRIERLLGPFAAALLGVASAFFCFAMPASMIGTVGLPRALASAQLPVALMVGLVVAAVTWFGFAAFDRAKRPHVIRSDVLEQEEVVNMPVLRRADVHPDAPPRRPIFAGSDLGTPLDLVDPLPAGRSEAHRLSNPVTIDHADLSSAAALVPASDYRDEPEPEPIEPALMLPVTIGTTAAGTIPDVPLPTVAALMNRLESALARKSLVTAGTETNVTALKREIRPIAGSLRAAIDELQHRAAVRR